MPSTRWTIVLSEEARRDFNGIVEWTCQTFGKRQVVLYQTTLLEALNRLKGGPTILGSRARDDLGPGLRYLRVTASRRRGRHVVIFREVASSKIEVVRILHDSMDPTLHLGD